MGRVECTFCGRKLEESYLKRHLRMKHRDVCPTTGKNVKVSCCLCQSKFLYRNEFRNHVAAAHKKIVEKSFEFNTWEEFSKWLKEEENSIKIHFVKRRTPTKLSNGNSRVQYFCQYDNDKEFKTIPKDKRKRALKHQGSYKMSGCCPAEILVERHTDGHVGVKYYSTHIGHDSSKDHFFLRLDEKKSLAEKIKAGVSFKEILNEIQDDSSKDPKKERSISRKTLHNIASKWKIKSWKQEPDDAANVSLWVENMKHSDYNPVCLFKMQGEHHHVLQENDFVLILVSEVQAKMLREFGNHVVCVDSIYGTNVYEFFLTVILIIDDHKEVFPGAYLMSNRTDANLMEIFFREICVKIDTVLSPIVFMSDESPSHYDSWIKVTNPDILPARRLCPWLLDKRWREAVSKLGFKNYKSLAKYEEVEAKRLDVYRSLRALLDEIDKTVFQKLLDSVLSELISTPFTKYFGQCFKKQYADNVDLWANCFRDETELDRIEKFEDFHRLMETVYNDCMKTKRLDTFIDALFQVAQDGECYQDTVSKELPSSVQKSNRVRKKKVGNNKPEVAENDSAYCIVSENEEEITYEVEKIREICPYACESSGHSDCLHLYQCSCTEFLINGGACEHIREVCNSQKFKENTVSVSFPDSTVIVYTDGGDIIDTLSEYSDTQEQKCDTIDTSSEYSDTQEQKKEENLLLEFDEKVQRLNLIMKKNVHSSSQVKIVNDLIEKAISLLTNTELTY